MTDTPATRCGYIALVGRPNVGKSTLLNRLIGQKLCITSRKPQTTRHRIMGIKTTADVQYVFVDTPGMHLDNKHAMNRYLNRAASTTILGVDVIVFVIDAGGWAKDDDMIVEKLKQAGVPVVLAINKVDRLANKEDLLPLLASVNEKMAFQDIIPLSATKGVNIEVLEQQLANLLPHSEFFFAEDQITDRSMRFVAAELIREKLIRRLGKELPYALTVEIEEYVQEDGMLNVGAVIWVERPGQKAIVIGKGGSMLKEIGRQSREELEKMLDTKVFVRLWVKVREGWSDDERALRSLGYSEDS
ncbi:GTPase Era [Sulfuriflexus sp.]|uniref:GTPase Era n=1 Tax=Sulfuriflexus sp. TaxID=2015443 RepID=UPI0028CD2121|nr:GTPase Era [Sulfuriflexus sp.]MDT8404871.1 GTPase Era [Sulfuriflexus sp.]